MTRLIAANWVTTGAFVLTLAFGYACTKAQTTEIVSDLTPIGACVVNQIMVGETDPMGIVAKCSGTTVESVVKVAETLLASGADASPLAANAAVVHANAKAILARRVSQ